MLLEVININHIIAVLALTYVPAAVREVTINLLLWKRSTTVLAIFNGIHGEIQIAL
jgi:hypothetical protein